MSTLTYMPLFHIINNLNMTIYHMCLGFGHYTNTLCMITTILIPHRMEVFCLHEEHLSGSEKFNQSIEILSKTRERDLYPIIRTLHPHKQIISLTMAHHHIGCRLWGHTNWNLYLGIGNGNQQGEKSYMTNWNIGIHTINFHHNTYDNIPINIGDRGDTSHSQHNTYIGHTIT